MNIKQEYIKTPSSVEEQITILESRGLIITDKQKSINILKEIGYYRFSGYTLFFEEVDGSNKRTHKFYKDTKFNDIYKLYFLDKKLRQSIFNIVTELEIYFKSKIIDSLSTLTNNTFVLYDKSIINDSNQGNITKYNNLLNSLNSYITKSDETFIKHYQKWYKEYPQLPIWMSIELMTFGGVSTLYSILKPEYTKSIRIESGKIGHKDLLSWLHSITYIRNLCAHNCRIFNRKIAISPRLDKLTEHGCYNIKLVENQYKHRIYLALVVIDYLVSYTNIDKSFITDIFNCINEIVTTFPHARKPMGIFFDGEIKSLYN